MFAVLAGAAIFGGAVEISRRELPAFQVGGGLVRCLMALAMLNAQAAACASRAPRSRSSSRARSPRVPLAVPLSPARAIGTPSSLPQAGGVAHTGALLGCIALVCAILWLVLRVADAVGQRLGTTGLTSRRGFSAGSSPPSPSKPWPTASRCSSPD